MFISDTERDSLLATFPKNHFPTILGGHLEFLRKTKKAFISETERDRGISMKFLTHRVSAECTGDFSKKNRFPAAFGDHFEFLRKTQKTCLSRKQSEVGCSNCIPDAKRGYYGFIIVVVRRDFLLATYSPHFFPDFFHIWQVA